jgi:hypothetical protein
MQNCLASFFLEFCQCTYHLTFVPHQTYCPCNSSLDWWHSLLQPLSLSQLASAMFVMIAGLLLSFVAFTVEISTEKGTQSDRKAPQRVAWGKE